MRHGSSSTSLKLKLFRGNIKAVQGDAGHAEARMDAHGFDADRKLIAREMDSGFFAKVGEEEPDAGDALMNRLTALVRDNPELVKLLLAQTDAMK